MPGFLGKYEGTDRIEVDGPEWWVDIKKALTVAEAEDADKAGVVFTVKTDPRNEDRTRTDVSVNPQEKLFEQVLASIVEWNLTDADGKLLPYDWSRDLEKQLKAAGDSRWPSPRRKSLLRLPQPIYDLISREVGRRNRPPTREEQVTFQQGNRSSDSDGQDTSPDFGEVLDGGQLSPTLGSFPRPEVAPRPARARGA